LRAARARSRYSLVEVMLRILAGADPGLKPSGYPRPVVRIQNPIVEGRLRSRYKRFLADVEVADGSVVTAHCPNPGRLIGCLEPGSRVLLRDDASPRRKLRYTWQAIEVDGGWVSVDTSLANRLVAESIELGLVEALAGYEEVRREVTTSPGSRLDLELLGGERPCFVEVKSTTLARGTAALFPDAVTTRGRKHLGELSRLSGEGARAVQFFLVGRGDVESFQPADDIDPAYGAALREAARAGVEILAYATQVRPDALELGGALEVNLGPG